MEKAVELDARGSGVGAALKALIRAVVAPNTAISEETKERLRQARLAGLVLAGERRICATDRARLLRCHVKSQGTKPQRCPFFAGIPCQVANFRSPCLSPPLQRPAAEPARAAHDQKEHYRDTNAKASRSSSMMA
jgi:hypothetical protein